MVSSNIGEWLAHLWKHIWTSFIVGPLSQFMLNHENSYIHQEFSKEKKRVLYKKYGHIYISAYSNMLEIVEIESLLLII